ncbi:helix-turn-helix domain-containing protein [Methylocystis sp. ATCC 49242]|uniref:helix-turn-helix domain-containing protein n=1 Tax=Methylocystis sp. ATCC 49242 TaxID=622637 RepID=UPI0001F86D5D|nr:helix-turn-helix domain-containing protein [Methylocystis sp. ATCC 49242]
MTADELRTLARQLLTLADQLEAGGPAAPATEDIWLSTPEAASLVGASRSTVIRWARRFKCGQQTYTGQWRFHRTRLLEIALNEAQRDANNANDANDAAIHNVAERA